MLLPTLADLSPASTLRAWLQHYCRLGYEAILYCRGSNDPDPFCQLLAARRQTLSRAAYRQLMLDYQLNEQQAQQLFEQWGHDLFGQLLKRGVMRHLDLKAALYEPLPK